VTLKPGEEKRVGFNLPVRDLAFYNTTASEWQVEDGTYDVCIGFSSRDIRLHDYVKVSSSCKTEIPDMRSKTPCYFDLSHGLNVSDREFETLIGRPLPPRERAKGAPHTISSTFSDIQDKWVGRQVIKYVHKRLEEMSADNADLKIMAEKMLMESPIRMVSSMDGSMTTSQLNGLVDLLNGHLFRGIIKFLKK
jgi:beta-glucosidase